MGSDISRRTFVKILTAFGTGVFSLETACLNREPRSERIWDNLDTGTPYRKNSANRVILHEPNEVEFSTGGLQYLVSAVTYEGNHALNIEIKLEGKGFKTHISIHDDNLDDVTDRYDLSGKPSILHDIYRRLKIEVPERILRNATESYGYSHIHIDSELFKQRDSENRFDRHIYGQKKMVMGFMGPGDEKSSIQQIYDIALKKTLRLYD